MRAVARRPLARHAYEPPARPADEAVAQPRAPGATGPRAPPSHPYKRAGDATPSAAHADHAAASGGPARRFAAERSPATHAQARFRAADADAEPRRPCASTAPRNAANAGFSR